MLKYADVIKKWCKRGCHSLLFIKYNNSLQIDFAENYSCVWQDEVQIAHWCGNQVTIFTVVMWSKNLTQSAVVISDNNDHKKESIATFHNKLL